MGAWIALLRKLWSVILRRKRVYAGVDYDGENATEDKCEYHHGKATDVQEVWFAGCHADVGGGSTPNNATHTLANPSLQWMISEVLAHVPEVLFRPDAFTYDPAFSTYTVTKKDRTPRLARPQVQSACHHVPTDDRPNGEDVEEEIVYAVKQTDPKQDANAKMHDQLVKQRVWRLLEYTPTSQFYQSKKGSWDWRFTWNVLQPRKIRDSTPNIHESVKLRENYEGKWFTKFIPEEGEQVKIKYVKSAARRPTDLR
ncbi:hypothetical protein FRC00_012871 [Tulasnella sp. 408]|nr:hypothetical protein FRC00_012871 [Tulasnella sp. 408]